MAARPNVAGLARLLYLVVGVGCASWALWGADPGWTKLAWLVVGGVSCVLAAIGYSPLHAIFGEKEPKAS